MTKKKKIILFSIIGVCVLGIITTTTLFLVMNVFRKGKKQDETVRVEDYDTNYDGVYASLNEKLAAKNYEQIISESTDLGIIQYSLSKKVNEKHYYSITKGTSKALIATQDIYATFIKNNDQYYQESISAGLINTAKCFYTYGNETKEYSGKVNSDKESATYDSSNFTKYTKEELFEELGFDYSKPTIYLIHKDTLLSSEKEKDNNDNFVIKASLNPTLSTLKYIRQQKHMGSLEAYPEFSKVELTFTIDKELNLLSLRSVETSRVKKGIWVTNNTDMIESFTFEAKEIPEI